MTTRITTMMCGPLVNPSLLPLLQRLIECLEFNEKSNTISWIKVRSEGDEFFDARANAAVAVMDHTLFVYGPSFSSSVCLSKGLLFFPSLLPYVFFLTPGFSLL